MGKLAPTEADRRAMAVIRAMQLRGFVTATDDDLRLRAIVEAIESDDSAVLEAWEEFVWRVAIARRTRERDARQREEREERARRRTETEERTRVAERDRRRLDEGWAAWADWAPAGADAAIERQAEAEAEGAAGGDGDDDGQVAAGEEEGDPWTSLGLDSLGTFWRDPSRDPSRSTPPPQEGSSRFGIQREPTPAPSRWSPPLPVERRARRRHDPASALDDSVGPIFVFDEPPERLHPAEERPIRVIDLARRSREVADTASAIRVQRAERAERAERERARASSSLGAVALGGASASSALGTSSAFGASSSALGTNPSSMPSTAARPMRRRSLSPPTGGSHSQSWLEEWSSAQPLLGRRTREDDDSPYALRRVRRRILTRSPGRTERDTRRDGIVFPDDLDIARMVESADAAERGELAERGEASAVQSGVGSRERVRRDSGEVETGPGESQIAATGEAEAPSEGATPTTSTPSAATENALGRQIARMPRPRTSTSTSVSQRDDFVQLG